jgi:hypothetical protein
MPLILPAHIKSTNFLIFLKVKTKVLILIILEILNAQRPIGNGESTAALAQVSSNLVGAAPPNWRSKASPIKNQGSCGSCWAFTSTGLYESFMIFKGKTAYDLSEEFILECTNILNANNYVSDCTGGYTDFAVEVVKKYGIPL